MGDPKAGTFFELDQDSLDANGNRMFGGIRALEGFRDRLHSIRENAADIQERVFLGEVMELAQSYIEAGNLALVEHAQAIGASRELAAPVEGEGEAKQ